MESHAVKVRGLCKAQGRALPACLPASASPCDNLWPPLTCNVQKVHDPLWTGGAKEDAWSWSSSAQCYNCGLACRARFLLSGVEEARTPLSVSKTSISSKACFSEDQSKQSLLLVQYTKP